LSVHVDIEVIRTGPDGKKRQEVDVMEMEKKMVKQEVSFTGHIK
jgi:hypothetical protein